MLWFTDEYYAIVKDIISALKKLYPDVGYYLGTLQFRYCDGAFVIPPQIVRNAFPPNINLKKRTMIVGWKIAEMKVDTNMQFLQNIENYKKNTIPSLQKLCKMQLSTNDIQIARMYDLF